MQIERQRLRGRCRDAETEMQRQRRRDRDAEIVADKTQLRAYVILRTQYWHSGSLCFASTRLSAHVGRVVCTRCSAFFAHSDVMEGPLCAMAHTTVWERLQFETPSIPFEYECTSKSGLTPTSPMTQRKTRAKDAARLVQLVAALAHTTVHNNNVSERLCPSHPNMPLGPHTQITHTQSMWVPGFMRTPPLALRGARHPPRSRNIIAPRPQESAARTVVSGLFAARCAVLMSALVAQTFIRT